MYPLYLCIDQAKIHHYKQMLEAFHSNGAQNIKDIKYLPVQSAKRLSPLDNCLFHEWKERVRQHEPLTAKNILTYHVK